MLIRNKLLLVAALILISAKGQCQNSDSKNKRTAPFILGITDTMYSRQLSETRVINIYQPEDYNTTNATYPVIYLLDGSANEDFIHIAGLVQYLSMYEIMPKAIVVGIANVDRKRDFTYPTTDKDDLKLVPTSGGSEKFISFIEKDLQPYIQAHYKVDNHKTIIGQSLGGLIATEILLKKPALFDDYIIVSPSLWWDKESLLKAAPQLLKSNLHTPVNVYVSVGSEGEQMEGDAKQLVSILGKASDKNIKISFVPFPQENHLTILHRAVYKGFEVLNKKDTTAYK